MKKTLLTLSTIALISNGVSAQNIQLVAENVAAPVKVLTMNGATSVSKAATTSTNDTLWYFYNKHYYRNTPAVGFNVFKSPYQASGFILANPASSFVNTNTVTVKGAYILAARAAASTNTTITVKVYLYNVDATYKPTTKVDSGLAVLTGTAGAFVGAMFTQPRIMTSYAIAFNAALPGDTIRVFMNNAATATSTVPVAQRYGEGLSNLLVNGVWTPQTGTWGANTDKEFVTIPIISIDLTAGLLPSVLPPYCVNVPVGFSNTSTSLFTERQYNLNQFFVTWPSVLTATANPVVDPIYRANFGDGTGLFNTFQTSHTYTAAGTFNGTLTANYQLGADNGQKYNDMISAPSNVQVCTGLTSMSNANESTIFPNPSNGSITISNLSYNSIIELVNILGESVYKEKVSSDSKSFDFSAFAKGNYYLKMTSTEGKVTVKKVNFN